MLNIGHAFTTTKTEKKNEEGKRKKEKEKWKKEIGRTGIKPIQKIIS